MICASRCSGALFHLVAEAVPKVVQAHVINPGEIRVFCDGTARGHVGNRSGPLLLPLQGAPLSTLASRRQPPPTDPDAGCCAPNPRIFSAVPASILYSHSPFSSLRAASKGQESRP